MVWLWLGLALMGLLVGVAVCAVVFHLHLRYRYMHLVVRIFQERPLFIIPRGQPVPGAEEVHFLTEDGRKLVGCYLSTPEPRLGVILFGLEFGSNRWACVPYCEQLRAAGFDIFTFEFRSQGESEVQPGYEPLQWVTDYEVRDMQAALRHLKQRPDADPRGVGFFGISKGGGAGLLAAAEDSYVRCCVTDGVFGTYTTMVPYMRKWISIYSKRYLIQHLMPMWYYGYFGNSALRIISRSNGCRFPQLEKAMPRLAPRPLLMIHGGADNYIKPDMAQRLFALGRQPKEFWQVEGAKHNQALTEAGAEYHQRVLTFFRTHLARDPNAEDSKQWRVESEAAHAERNGHPKALGARRLKTEGSNP